MDADEFDDGTSIEWFSRETLLYREGAYSVEIGYEIYEIGRLFKSGRKVFGNRLQEWAEFPEGTSPVIAPETKKKIAERAAEYFRKRGLEVEAIDS